jgi:hypothetical protein
MQQASSKCSAVLQAQQVSLSAHVDHELLLHCTGLLLMLLRVHLCLALP